MKEIIIKWINMKKWLIINNEYNEIMWNEIIIIIMNNDNKIMIIIIIMKMICNEK